MKNPFASVISPAGNRQKHPGGVLLSHTWILSTSLNGLSTQGSSRGLSTDQYSSQSRWWAPKDTDPVFLYPLRSPPDLRFYPCRVFICAIRVGTHPGAGGKPVLSCFVLNLLFIGRCRGGFYARPPEAKIKVEQLPFKGYNAMWKSVAPIMTSRRFRLKWTASRL